MPELSLDLGEGNFIRPRVDFGQEIAGLYVIAFLEGDFHQATGTTVPSPFNRMGTSAFSVCAVVTAIGVLARPSEEVCC